MNNAKRIEFRGSHGGRLSARLDLPTGCVKAYALFAHCFTCGKDINIARKLAHALARRSIATLRFDFTGIGKSEGNFSATGFSSNIEDFLLAAKFMRENFDAPQILVGHSFGGAAALAAASSIDEAKAVVVIAAPSDAKNICYNLGSEKVVEIRRLGEGKVNIGGRSFSIRRQFIEDLENVSVRERVSNMNRALLILHSPLDKTVGIENAQEIFAAARHPKSFVSLDDADHLLSRGKDIEFAANVIAAWSARYIRFNEKTSSDAMIKSSHAGSDHDHIAKV